MGRGKQILKEFADEDMSIKGSADEFYMHNKAKGLALSTQKTYKRHVDMFIRWLDADIALSEITPRLVDEYLTYLHERGNKAVSIATAMRHLRRFFNFCYGRGYMSKLDITLPKYQVELKEPYTDEEMALLLVKPTSDSWVEYRNWCMINYFYGTGHRLSTVINIKVKDLDLERARVKLSWNKDKIQKWMPLSKSIVKILREYISLSDLSENDYLFPEYEGKQLQIRSAQQSISDYNKSRGVEKTSIHLFRHTFAKNYIMAGGNPVKLQHLLNHKTINMTMRYVNLYGNEIATDFDLYNPLENFRKENVEPIKRVKVKKG